MLQNMNPQELEHPYAATGESLLDAYVYVLTDADLSRRLFQLPQSLE